MAEISTVARPYAEALFAAAQLNKSVLAAWLGQVQCLADVMHIEDAQQAMSNPKLTNAQRENMLCEVAEKYTPQPLVAEVRNLLALLVENDRLAALPEIAAKFEALKDQAEGVAQANIVSAFPMTDEQIKQLITLIEPKFGLKLKPHVQVDANLIGGVRVTVGDHVLDTSVQAQLTHMREALVA
jgi:F-type H+-transporting ATPase subunit delta